MQSIPLPECDALFLWLARLPIHIQNNQPRTFLLPKAWDDTVRVVHDDELLVSVFERLTQDGFSGCPVVDVSRTYLTRVDILDIFFYVCSLFKARQPTNSDQHTGLHSDWNHIQADSHVLALYSCLNRIRRRRHVPDFRVTQTQACVE